MEKILIVEDDEQLREELALFLRNNGYECEIMEGRESIVSDIVDCHGDLLLLDINLPFADGQHICLEVRKHSDIPIIMVTSMVSEMDELISLSNGADQYVTKPYNTRILLMKIRGLLKRSQKSGIQNEIPIGDAMLDISKNSIVREDKEVELTKNEYEILFLLLRNQGTIVSRDDIIGHLWDNEAFVDDNTLTVNVQRLRGKLAEAGLDSLIETKRGRGYLIR